MPPPPPSIHLAPSASGPLPTTSPHLMPFHIAHTGPAPLSTYFLVKPLAAAARRCVAAFRGRTMQGVVVDVPEGYCGVLLCADEGKAARAAPQKKGPKTRRSGRGRKNEDEEDVDTMQLDADADANDENAEAHRTLRPTAKFASFTLWNADVEVDPGRDEYLRFLSEYHRLSTEVHRIP